MWPVTPVHVVRCVCVCVREFRITDGVQTECFGNHFKNCESAIAIISPCTSLVAASVLSAVMRCIQWVVHVCICIICVCVYTYWPASCCCSLSRRCNFFSSSLYFVTSCATTASICPDIALAASSSAAITRMQALSSNTIRERTHYTRVSKFQSFQSRFFSNFNFILLQCCTRGVPIDFEFGANRIRCRLEKWVL